MSTGMQLRNGHIVGQNILPVQGRPAFEEGVRLIFAKWTALALAVENQWGGGNSKEKAELLYQDCLDWFYKKRDRRGPGEAVPGVGGGSTAYLEHLRAMAAAGARACKRQVVDLDGTVVAEEDADGMETSSDEGDDEEGEDRDGDTEMGGGSEAPRGVPLEPPAPRVPVVDEEGFTMVQGKGRKGRR
eukprot:XP_001702727.1 predicted protein [Chlamydomonas reinhardtii]